MIDRVSQVVPPKFVLILGMHRSGTSALSRVLNLAGLRLPKDLLVPNQDNPLGYWEPKNIVKINNQLLKQFDRHWADPKPMPEGWAEQYKESTGLSNILKALQSETVQTVDRDMGVVIKDPRLSRVMPVWQKAFQQMGAEAVCLIACRNPLEVFGSLKARDRFEINHALELWLSYMLEAEIVTRDMPRVVVHYDSLLTDWDKTLKTIWDVTDMPGLAISDAKEQQIDSFLDKNLRHHELTLSELEDCNPLHKMVKATYELYTRVGGLSEEDLFDDLNKQRKMLWSERSPGKSGSGIVYQIPSWHVEQGWDFIASGDNQKALCALDTAIELAPDVARSHFVRGLVLAKMGQTEAALQARRTAVQLDGTVARFHRAFCDNLNELSMFEEAADAIGVLAQLEPTAVRHHQHGNWLARINRLAEAIAAHRRAVALDKTQYKYYLALANLTNRMGSKNEACQALSKAIHLAPPSADLYDQLGQLHANLNNWRDASNAFDKAIELRYQLFGFRKTPTGEGIEKKKVNAKAQLTSLLARLGSRYWAEDLTQQSQQVVISESDQTKVWPVGRSVQVRPFVPIADSGIANSESDPLLSIMIPVHQVENEQWLQVCLDSVLSQDKGPDWAEIIIVDDASNDMVAQRVAKTHAPRVRYIQNKQNMGLVGNHNHCISLARGTFVHILHQDDYVEQGFYDALLSPLQADDTLVAGFTHNRFIDSGGHPLSKSDPPRPSLGTLKDWHIRLSLELRIQFPSIIVRRSSYLKAGGFYSGRRFSFDWDLWNRIAAIGPVWYDPRPLAQYRVHESSASYQFTMKDRVVDLMQTVASMVQLLPSDLQLSTAEMGIYKFFLRYWGLVTEVPYQTIPLEQSELIDFLLKGWTKDQEQQQLLKLLHELTN